MRNMTLAAIAAACEGHYFGSAEKAGTEVESVVIDSRMAQKDCLFIAVRGERVDGHDFIGQVMEAGAAGVVCEKVPEQTDTDIPYILVEDSLAALRRIAEYYRKQLSVKVIGITGSVGKTTTKEFISGVLEQKYKVLKTEGNFNNEIGLPLTVLKIREEHEVAVLEMGINHFGEMDRLGQIAVPDICVMTNIGQCHLEYLGSREGILKAKSEVLAYLKPEGSLCLNGDDDMLSTIREINGKKPVRFGLSSGNDVFAEEIKDNGLFGTECVITSGLWKMPVRIPLPGRHMIYNALAATAVGCLLGVEKESIAAGIAGVSAVSGRSHIITAKEYVIIDDCYNANPVSMRAAIDLLMLAKGRKVAILGDMGELGEDEVKMHEDTGRYAAARNVDQLICIGRQSAHMAAGADTVPVCHIETVDEALDKIPALLQKGDTILIKASHFMKFDRIVNSLLNQ